MHALLFGVVVGPSVCTLACLPSCNAGYQFHSIFMNSLVPAVQNYHCESFFAARPEILFEPPLRTEILFVEEGRRAPISNCSVNNAFTFPTSDLFPGMCNLTIPVLSFYYPVWFMLFCVLVPIACMQIARIRVSDNQLRVFSQHLLFHIILQVFLC